MTCPYALSPWRSKVNGGRQLRALGLPRPCQPKGIGRGRDNTSETRRLRVDRQDCCRPRGKNHPVRRNLASILALGQARYAQMIAASAERIPPARARRTSGGPALAWALPRGDCKEGITVPRESTG